MGKMSTIKKSLQTAADKFYTVQDLENAIYNPNDPFHETLEEPDKFMEKMQKTYATVGALGGDIDTFKQQQLGDSVIDVIIADAGSEDQKLALKNLDADPNVAGLQLLTPSDSRHLQQVDEEIRDIEALSLF